MPVHPNDVFGVLVDDFWHPIVEKIENINGVQGVWLMKTACDLGVYEKLENFSTNVRWHAVNVGSIAICPMCAKGPQPIILTP